MAGPLQGNPRWRWAAASKIGTSHQRLGTRKQDAYRVSRQGEDSLCAVISDGAGSASHGGEGASLVCRWLTANVKQWLLAHDCLPDDEQVLCWVDDTRDRLSEIATKRDVTRRQFAATLVMLIAHRDEMLALQVGDSALVGRKDGAWEAICWPENGEFASTTYFVTDDPTVRLRSYRLPLEHDAFAMFSDGLESVALEHLSHQPYPRFLDPMIKPVDLADGHGRLRELSKALGRYLESPGLCDRTDDDKTLILISRQ